MDYREEFIKVTCIKQKEKDKVIEESLRLLRISINQSCGCIDHYLTDIEELIQDLEINIKQ